MEAVGVWLLCCRVVEDCSEGCWCRAAVRSGGAEVILKIMRQIAFPELINNVYMNDSRYESRSISELII